MTMTATLKTHGERPGTTPTYVTATTIAKMLEISIKSVRRYARRGIIPASLKIGRVQRWHLQTVLDALTAK